MVDGSSPTPIEIDLTPREFDPDEEEVAVSALEEDLPGFRLIPLHETGSRVLTALRQEFSPPLQDLATHAARVLARRGITVEEEKSPGEQELRAVQVPPDAQEPRDVRLYHARHGSWPDDRPSIAVVIELDLPHRTGQVLGIG